jgi:pilus assembly protein CpaC
MNRLTGIVLIVLGGFLMGTSIAADPVTVNIEVGSAHVVRVQGARQVAVGNSQLIQASAASATEVILFAKSEGTTTVDVWTKQGTRQAFKVIVHPAGLQQRLSQVKQVIASLSGVRVRLSGQHILIEGEQVSTEDRARLKKLLSKYPEVVDLTSETSWDPMVLLDVQVLELPSRHLRELGVRWDPNSLPGVNAGGSWSAGTAGLPEGLAQVGVSGAAISVQGSLATRLQAMAQAGDAVLLAQPQLLARSGSPASFLAGGEVPYAHVTKDGKPTTIFKKYGVQLNVTPQVDRHGAIRAKVDVEVSAIDPSVNTPVGPAMRVRKTTTEFNIRSGQTLVLSGFISNEKSNQVEGLPSAMNAPWIGGLFGARSERQQQTELAIFVTPVLVDANHPDMMARVVRAEAVRHDELGYAPVINSPVQSQPLNDQGHWHPAHPALSQWESGRPQANSSSWNQTDKTEN